jgi:hypothetical protein
MQKFSLTSDERIDAYRPVEDPGPRQEFGFGGLVRACGIGFDDSYSAA